MIVVLDRDRQKGHQEQVGPPCCILTRHLFRGYTGDEAAGRWNILSVHKCENVFRRILQ